MRMARFLGYAQPAYAQALPMLGQPLLLPASGGVLLCRSIPETDASDAIGPYPLFSCANWENLADEMIALDPQLVSITLVTDPFGRFDLGTLRKAFPDVLRPFKHHLIVDLERPHPPHPSHRRNIRRALQALRIEMVEQPSRYLQDWCALYQVLIQRHNITGVATFSEASFAAQLALPGMVATLAWEGEELVGMVL